MDTCDITMVYGKTPLIVLRKDAFITSLKNACNGADTALCTGSGVIWDSSTAGPLMARIVSINLKGASIFPDDLSYYFGWNGVPWASGSTFWIAAHTGVKSKDLFRVTPMC